MRRVEEIPLLVLIDGLSFGGGSLSASLPYFLAEILHLGLMGGDQSSDLLRVGSLGLQALGLQALELF